MPSDFEFYTCNHLNRLLKISARNIKELLQGLESVPDSSIYAHTFKFVRSHHYLINEPSNDFAYWTINIYKDEELGEILSSVNPFEYNTISELRKRFCDIIKDYLIKGRKRLIDVPDGQEFNFIDCLSLIYPLRIRATNIYEFCEAIEKISLNSIYFHMFEARLRLHRADNDFTLWLKDMGEQRKAEEISKLNIYYMNLSEIREEIIKILKQD